MAGYRPESAVELEQRWQLETTIESTEERAAEPEEYQDFEVAERIVAVEVEVFESLDEDCMAVVAAPQVLGPMRQA